MAVLKNMHKIFLKNNLRNKKVTYVCVTKKLHIKWNAI